MSDPRPSGLDAPPGLYLDHAATSWPKAPGVADAMVAALDLGNPGRGAHDAALAAGRLVHRARAASASFVGAADARTVLTHGATSALNIAITGLLRPGDHAVTTDLEHNGVRRPLAALARRGVEVSVVRSARGVVSPDAIAAALRPTTRLVALTHASNVLGTVQPIEDAARLCAERGIALVVDAAQTAGHLPLAALPHTAVAFGAHKGLRGPAGVGVLALGEGVEPRPLEFGGTGFDSRASGMPDALPARLEPGTPNLPGIAGLLAAVSAWTPSEAIQAMDAARTLRAALAQTGSWWTPAIDEASWAVPVLAGLVTDAGGVPLDPALIADALAQRGIAARAGFHCAPDAHAAYDPPGTSGLLRLSPGPLSTAADMAAVVDAIGALSAEASR